MLAKAMEVRDQIQAEERRHYDKKRREPPQYKVGDLVSINSVFGWANPVTGEPGASVGSVSSVAPAVPGGSVIMDAKRTLFSS